MLALESVFNSEQCLCWRQAEQVVQSGTQGPATGGGDRIGDKINRAAATAVSESEGEDATARDGPMPGGSRAGARRPSQLRTHSGARPTWG
jgi:hypothetical protein